uniref:Uncharacterized protein n=1 Tax=Oryza punctata TaxID=4537 RepID=A0A0E0L121_ORYPU
MHEEILDLLRCFADVDVAKGGVRSAHGGGRSQVSDEQQEANASPSQLLLPGKIDDFTTADTNCINCRETSFLEITRDQQTLSL